MTTKPLRAVSAKKRVRALFVPLKRQYYEAFARGEKTHEYRKYGHSWNEFTCRIGRPVTLSMGYGKKHRLHGVVTSFRVEPFPEKIRGFVECYGTGAGCAAVIGIAVLRPTGGTPCDDLANAPHDHDHISA